LERVLSIFLVGKKLKGEWTLQRIESAEEKTRWLLRKTNGDARVISAKADDVSVLTGRAMEKIAADKSTVWRTNRNGEEAVAVLKTKPVDSRPRTATPRFVKPMKATAVSELPEGNEWIYE
jgi:bifunctional non-homologous end joining protein LigD